METPDSTKPHVSVMVHNFKGLKKLENCLISLHKTDYPNMKIIVVDALTDGIEDWMQAHFKDVDVLHFDKDYGIPFHRNAGLKLVDSRSKYVVFMDEDLTVSDTWLLSLVEAMESYPKIGAAQPVMLSMHESGRIDNAGCYIDFFGYPHKLTLNRRELGDSLRDVSYAETAVIIVRRDFLSTLPNSNQPFDSDYFFHWDDIDFCWKILLSGYRIVIVPHSVVYHERGMSAGSGMLPSQDIFINTRNHLVTLLKNYSCWNLARFVPSFIGLELTKIIILLKTRPEHAIATIHGMIFVFRNLEKILLKRLIVQKQIRKIPDECVLTRFLKPNLLRLYRDFNKNYN